MSTVKTFKFTIRSRWTGNPVFECDLEAKFESASEGVKLGAAVKMAIAAKADLSGADLRSAVLSGADLSGAVLRSADLSGAVLSGAVLRDLKDGALALAQTSIVPETGAYTAWKKCRDGVVVKLLIPEDAARSNASGRKCRAAFADVLEILGPKGGKRDVAVSIHRNSFEYRVGQRVTADEWCKDRWQECAGGIHHFITRAEAEAYDL